MQRGFAGGANGAGVVDVLTEIGAEIDPGDNQIGRFGQEAMESDDYGVGRSAFDGPLALADVVTNNRLSQGQRLRRSTLLTIGRHDTQCGKSFESRGKRL